MAWMTKHRKMKITTVPVVVMKESNRDGQKDGDSDDNGEMET